MQLMSTYLTSYDEYVSFPKGMRLTPHIMQPETESNRVDPVYSTAATLRSAYLASSLNADDGADFHEFNAAFKLCAPPHRMAESNN